MNLDHATSLVEDINKTSLIPLKNDLINYAVEYSGIRVEWYLATEHEKKEMEVLRRAKHNAFIDSCNIFSREMIKSGEDASWRRVLGDERIVIGDFACYINLILGIRGR